MRRGTNGQDWADDVAYSSTTSRTRSSPPSWTRPCGLPTPGRVCRGDAAEYAPDAQTLELSEALDRLLALDGCPRRTTSRRRALTTLKDLTSQLIGRFCSAAEGATRAHWGSRPLTRYAADLLRGAPPRLEVAVLKYVAAHFVMQAEARAPCCGPE